MSNIIENKKFDIATESLRVIAHPIRLSIINYIGKEKEINVNSIYNTLKLEQSITSQHLKLLRETGIVKTERKGKFIIYSLNYKKIKRIVDGVNKFLGTRK